MLPQQAGNVNSDTFDKYYSVREAAGILGVTSRAVQKWIRDGKLRAFRLGRILKVAAGDLRKFIEDRATVAA